MLFPLRPLSTEIPAPAALLETVLAISLNGVVLMRPLYRPDGELADFALEYINPAGQQMLGMPERPTGSLLTRFPHTQAVGTFSFCRRVFTTNEPGRYNLNYQHDGLDNYYHIAAQRCGPVLVANFTDTADQDRSAVEEALRASQAREYAAHLEVEHQRAELQRVFEQAPMAFAVLQGPQYVVKLVNPAICTMWGRTPAQVLDMPMFELIPEAAGQGFEELLDGVMATGVPYVAYELPSSIDRNGGRETVYWNFIYYPFREADGRVTGVTVVATDVTKEVTTRQQLMELNQELEARVAARTQDAQDARAEAERQRARLLLITDALPVLISYVDHEQRYRFTNQAYEAWFRQTLDELIGQRVEDVVGPQAYASARAYIARALAGERLDFEAEMIYQSDMVRHTRTSFVPDGPAGQVQGFYSLVVDVTPEVEARRETERQRQLLHRLFMEAPVPIVIMGGPELVCELVNPAYQALLPGRALLGLPLLTALAELADTPVPALLRQVYETGETFVAHEMPLWLARQAGTPPEETFFTVIYQARRDAQGAIDGVLVFAHEVTEQVRARRVVVASEHLAQALATRLEATNTALAGANQQLTRTNVDLDSFIYTASHDLRAPITNIEGLLTALREEWPAANQTTDVPAMLAMMLESVDRFKMTIDHLTEVTKLQKEHDQPTTQVALAAVVAGVCLDLEPQFAQAGAQLDVDIDPALHVAFSVKNLRSVVYNLLSNAVKYCAPDRALHVQVRCRQEAEYAVLTVQDNGLGLSPAQQGQLFVLFRRLHSHVEGSGVGLYMVKRSVENAGGRVEVSSEVGVGSTFAVFFCC